MTAPTALPLHRARVIPSREMASANISRVDLQACQARLAGGSRSFLLASRLLPARVAESATVFYAFCRVADDAIDDARGDARTAARLRRRLEAIYRGAPEDHPEDRALAVVQWDADGRRYATLGELEDYGARVAGSVGAVMALFMGERRPRQLARACELGVAMQLTNICRDVAEDAAIGRLYLPEDALRRAGIDPAGWLKSPQPGPQLNSVVALVLARAEALYRQAGQGIRRLPRRVRPGITAAALLYEAIGGALESQGADPFRGRARVPRWRQSALLIRSLLPLPNDRQTWLRPPIAAVQFLVDEAVAADPTPPVTPSSTRLELLIDLFIRLEERSGALRRDGEH